METDWKSKLHAQQFLGHKDRITVRVAIEQFCDSKKGTPAYMGLLSTAKVVGRLLPTHKDLDELNTHDLERFKRDRMDVGVSSRFKWLVKSSTLAR